MSRSLRKGFFVDHKLLSTVIKLTRNKPKDEVPPIKTNCRGTTIIEPFIGLMFLVHDGRKYVKVFITESMIGHKLGSFVLTRKIPVHPKKVKNKTAKKGRV